MQNWDFYVAGVKFHQLNSVIDEMEEGELLTLKPEPDNKYDSNAMKILRDGVMLGYVPGKISSQVTYAFKQNETLKCLVTKLRPENEPWNQLKVSISA